MHMRNLNAAFIQKNKSRIKNKKKKTRIYGYLIILPFNFCCCHFYMKENK